VTVFNVQECAHEFTKTFHCGHGSHGRRCDRRGLLATGKSKARIAGNTEYSGYAGAAAEVTACKYARCQFKSSAGIAIADVTAAALAFVSGFENVRVR
jgi:hypothetical protein